MNAGDVVRATAGKDRGKVFLVLQAANGFVYIADGRRRKVQRPKRKKDKHVCLLDSVGCPQPITNKTVLKLLQPFYSTKHKEEN